MKIRNRRTTKLLNIPWKTIGSAIGKHAPSILTGVGIGGYITATVMAVRATPKYQDERLIEAHTVGRDEYGERIIDSGHKLETKKEAILLLKHYWPTMLVIGGSTACVLLANHMNLQRQAALAAACSISETALKNYKAKAIEVLGPKEEQKQIEHAVNEDFVNENKDDLLKDRELYPIEMEAILDKYSGTVFYTTEEDIRQVLNTFNGELIREDYLYYEALWDEICEKSGNKNKIVKPDCVRAAGFIYDGHPIEYRFDTVRTDCGRVTTLSFQPEPKTDPRYFY